MTILQAIILGIVEGLTEFLPISSTFHLIFASKILGLEQTDFVKMFEVFIQAGAILAVFGLYGREVWKDKKLIKSVVFSFVPTAMVGFLLHSIIKKVLFESDFLMLSAFVGVGVVFVVYEWWQKKGADKSKMGLDALGWKLAVVIGLGQSLAVLPGVSRAGAVMLTMMVLGFGRSEAAKYSFLLAVPTICAAALLDILKLQSETAIAGNELMLLLVGTIAAFVSAYFVLAWFIAYLQKHSLASFGVYRIIAGFLLVFMLAAGWLV